MTTDEPRRPGLAWLNYHHLLYFYTVAREGGIARASAVLHLTQPTVSSRIKALEKSLGEKLFERSMAPRCSCRRPTRPCGTRWTSGSSARGHSPGDPG
jgi:regulatory helix-turn-helix LysR family protein